MPENTRIYRTGTKPFTMVRNDVLEDARLTHCELRVWIALFSFADWETGKAFPSHAAIGKRAGGISRQSVVRCMKRLEDLGYLSAERHNGYVSTYVVTDEPPKVHTMEHDATPRHGGSNTTLQGVKQEVSGDETRGFTNEINELEGHTTSGTAREGVPVPSGSSQNLEKPKTTSLDTTVPQPREKLSQKQRTAKSKSTLSDADLELYHEILKACQEKSGPWDSTDFKREGPAIKRMIGLAHENNGKDAREYVGRVFKTFEMLKEKRMHRLFRDQPFRPSIVVSSGLWPHVKEAMKTDMEPLGFPDGHPLKGIFSDPNWGSFRKMRGVR